MSINVISHDANDTPAMGIYVPGVGLVTAQAANANTDGLGITSAALATGRFGQTVLNQASAAQNASGNSANLDVDQFTELALDVNVTALTGTSPTLTIFIERLGADGIWYSIYSPTAISTVSKTSTSIGAGLATNASFGTVIRFRWVIGGTASPTVTFSASILGK